MATPKQLGGAAILNLEMHLMAHRFPLLRDMCQQYKLQISMMQYFIEHDRLVIGKTKIQAPWWTLLHVCIPLKIQHFECAHNW